MYRLTQTITAAPWATASPMTPRLLGNIFRRRAVVAGLLGLSALSGLATVAQADVYISDGDRIGRYSNAGALINADFVSLTNVTGLTVGPDGYLYAGTETGDGGAPGIFRFDAGTGAQIGAPFVPYHGVPPTPDPRDVIDPQGLRFGADNRLYVADINGSTNNVHVYDALGNSITSLNSPSPQDPGGPILNGPRAVALDSQHPQRLYVANGGSVLQYDFGTQRFTTFTQPGPVALNDPKDLAFGPDHKLYVLDWSGSTPDVLRYNADGTNDASFLINFAQTTFFPAGLAFGADGKVLVSGWDANYNTGSVLQFNLDGTSAGTFISPGSLTYYDSFMAVTPEPSTALALTFATLLLRRRR